MGQSSSRNRSQPAPPSTPRAVEPIQPREGPSTSSVQQGAVVEDPASATASSKRRRRKSFRRSILRLVPNSSASSSTQTAKDNGSSTSEEGHQSFRKRWRSSRRWSKAPTELAQLTPPSQESAANTSETETGASGTASSSLGVAEVVPVGTPSHTNSPSTPSPVSRSSTSRGGSHAQGPSEGSSDEDRQQGSSTDNTSVDVSSSSNPTNLNAEPPSTSPRRPSSQSLEREVNEFLRRGGTYADGDSALPTTGHGHDHPAQQTSAVVEPNPQPSPAPPRHFASPGPLVVVQGVVNTTDSPHAAAQTTQPAQHALGTGARPSTATQSQAPAISRRRSLSIPRPASRSTSGEERNRRHRLSSLIRPTSMLGRGLTEGSSRGTPASSSTPEFTPPELASSNGEAALPANAASTTNAGDVPATPAPEHNHGARGLSQGSIDVLGTLLSVAAAATAASLFSPGLPYSNGNNGGVAPLNPGTRPLSPTPTAGLGALGGLGGMPGLGLNPAVAHSSPGAPQDSRDRIRGVWESLRERVGLNPRNSVASAPISAAGPTAAASGADRSAPNEDASTGDRQRMRPGELMLAEMARALNAGLGLANGGGERRAAEQPGTAESNGNNMMFAPIWDPNQPLPPEGSFERFLVNLQADLRTVLGDDSSAVASDQTHPAATVPEPEQEHEPAAVSSAETPETAHTPEASITDASGPPEQDDETDAPPPLDDDTDSEDVFEDAEEEGNEEEEDAEQSVSEHEVLPAPRTPTPIPPAGDMLFGSERPTSDIEGRNGEVARPAVNLWRLYRFDPIPAAQTQEATTRPASSLGSETASLVSSTSPVLSAPYVRDSTETDRVSERLEAGPSQPAPQEQHSNVVVPVIVVGLQSVDVPGQEDPDEEVGLPHDINTSVPPSDDSLNDLPVQDGHGVARSNPRGRTWHSRAANALRTLRPGRRATSPGRRTTEGTGSRTFLIYVIGGYYPPNHHMVTGSDSLDSYEALWELAELLGQVKPPTATRDDIDKSGLQIIKASDLARYEKDGRVQSNCVERCLICLDDYGSDDDLRLMSCRHTFHKECVDKWLQVGRNNCPACRSKGVTVPGDSSPAIPASNTPEPATSA